MIHQFARFRWRTLFVVLSATLSATGSPQPDLNGYDKLAFDYTASTTPALLDRQLQNFIYTHWRQRRRAFALIKIITLGGENRIDIIKQMFVEPTKNVSWHIRGVVEASVSPLRWAPVSQKKPAREVRSQFDAASAEWAGGDRHLVLKDGAGKVVDSF